jgi:hypothetical protein
VGEPACDGETRASQVPAVGRSGRSGATERVLIPGGLPVCPQGLPTWQQGGRERQQSAEAIVPVCSASLRREGPNIESQGTVGRLGRNETEYQATGLQLERGG